MSISRWKVMAGVLGLSIGGLAAVAGQCPKPDDARTTARRADDRQGLPDLPKVPSGGSGPAKPLDVPPPVELPGLPPLPAKPADVTPPPMPTAPAKPATTPAKPESLPALPMPTDLPKPVEPVKKPEPAKPDVIPAGAPTIPAGPPIGTNPAPLETIPTKPSPAPSAPPAPPSTGSTTTPVFPTPAVPPSSPAVPPSAPPALVTPEPMIDTTPIKPMVIAPAPAANVPAAQTKFRILLRVGEGEPMFEVRHGDDLVMKVVCEKVDVKSSEKGVGLSEVTATGKVRFVGFGSEGSCDKLWFVAGTGEVQMAGKVTIQVKDKLGRVESELTTEAIKYKIDASPMPGAIRP